MIGSVKEDLPQGWQWKTLDQIVDCVSGAWGHDFEHKDSIPIPVIGTSNITNDGHLSITDAPIRHLSKNDISAIANEGDLLVVKSSGSASNIRSGKTAICPEELSGKIACANFVMRLIPDKNEVVPYLLWLLLNSEYAKHFIKQIAGSSTYPNIKWNEYKNLEIPLPPLSEQKRITAILSEQLNSVEKARKASQTRLEAARALSMAYLREVFESEEAKGWKSDVLGAVCEIQLGKMLSPKSKTGTNSKLYLRNANVQWNRFDLAEIAEMDFDEREAEKFSLKAGDLLVCEGGEPGRSAIWQGQIISCYYQKALHRLRPIKDVNPYFILYRLWYGASKSEFAGDNAKTTIAHLPVVRLKKLPLSLPDIHRQEQLVGVLQERLKAADNLVAYIEAELSNIEKLPAAHLRLAFSGTL